VGSHTFFSDGESRRINGGILGGLLQANKKVKDKGACACKKTIAADRNKRKSTGKKLLEKVQSEVVKPQKARRKAQLPGYRQQGIQNMGRMETTQDQELQLRETAANCTRGPPEASQSRSSRFIR
jgi:hypothetical protein